MKQTKIRLKRKGIETVSLIFCLLLVASVIMSSCGTISYVCNKSINRLEKDTIPFNSLPAEVKDFINEYKKIRGREASIEFFLNSKNVPSAEKHELSINKWYEPFVFIFNTAYEYQFKTIDAVKDLWISHYLLIDKTNKITYRINYGRPVSPIFVYNNEIFIPIEEYNLFSVIWGKDLETFDLDFVRYLLDSDRKYRRKTNKKK